MIAKIVLLILAGEGYHPVEYGVTREILENAGIIVKVACDKKTASARPSINHSAVCTDPACNTVADEYPQFAHARVDLLVKDIDPAQFDGIFIIGGPGAMEFLDNEQIYALMQKVALSGKPYGAICVAPRILAHAGILKHKKATGWNGDGKLPSILQEHKASYQNSPVVIDSLLITADGPWSAQLFGEAIIKVIADKK